MFSEDELKKKYKIYKKKLKKYNIKKIKTKKMAKKKSKMLIKLLKEIK